MPRASWQHISFQLHRSEMDVHKTKVLRFNRSQNEATLWTSIQGIKIYISSSASLIIHVITLVFYQIHVKRRVLSNWFYYQEIPIVHHVYWLNDSMEKESSKSQKEKRIKMACMSHPRKIKKETSKTMRCTSLQEVKRKKKV